MAFKDEDFVEIEYSAWDTSANRLIATTDVLNTTYGTYLQAPF